MFQLRGSTWTNMELLTNTTKDTGQGKDTAG